MGSIKLTAKQIDSGVLRAAKIGVKADTNGTKMVYQGEVNKYKGPGAAALKKVFQYAQRIEGSGEKASLVPLTTYKRALTKLANGLKTVANTKGNKDGILNGTAAELGKASTSGAALARFIHDTKP